MPDQAGAARDAAPGNNARPSGRDDVLALGLRIPKGATDLLARPHGGEIGREAIEDAGENEIRVWPRFTVRAASSRRAPGRARRGAAAPL